ncbi:MAG: hypothetical protein PHY43_15315 [Verrucomicrobiales bacterium]|nr:hypothetical protein [Verrucomicrobiales bacterium]
MKTLAAIILALGVGFAAAYVVVSKQKDAQLEKLKAQPQVADVAAPAPAPVEKVVMISAPAAPAEESAQDILNDLLNVKLGSGSERNTGLRMVVFKLEMLAQRGKLAVPAIREFIGRNVDVTYSQQDNPNSGSNRGNGGGFGGRGGARRARNLQTLQADWVVPPSLRLGLVGTLKEIGGEESEVAMAEMLSTTGRGVEVAYLAVMLEEIAPGKYRAAAVSAAKDLLMNPPAIDSPDRLDDLSKSYLYGVLEYFKDTSFAINAQQLLVGKDGRLDQDAMDYLATVMKDQSVSALYAAYENPALTNRFDKMRVGREVLNYVGQNSQANALFTETLNNPDLDSRTKAFTIMQMAGGGFGPFASDSPTDPQVVSSRLGLLNSLLAQPQFANDPMLSRVLPPTITALQSGQPIKPEDLQGVFGGGRRGGFGGGNGEN